MLISFAIPLAAVGGGVTWHAHRHDPPKPGFAIELKHGLVVGGLILLASLPWGAYGLTYHAMGNALAHLSPDEQTFWYTANPIVVTLGAGLLCVVFVVLHFLKARVPTLVFAGCGLVLVGIGTAVLAAALSGGPSVGLAMTGLMIASVGEVLAGPLLLSRIAGDMPNRLVCVVPALWLFITGAISSVSLLIAGASPNTVTVMIWIVAVLSLVVGVAIAIGAFPLRKVFPAPDASTA